MITIHSQLALIYVGLKDFSSAYEHNKIASDITAEIWGTNSHNYAECIVSLALIQSRAGRLAEAEANYKMAIDLIISLGMNLCSVLSIGALQNLGNLLRKQGRFDEALEYAIQARDGVDKMFGSTHPNTVRMQNVIDEIRNEIG